MKAKPCTVYANNRWGYCYQPIKCESIAKARKVAKNFWFSRIVIKDSNGTRVIRARGED